MDSSSTNYSTTPLIPNRNAAHPSLAPVNIDALRQSLLGPEQQATQEVVTQLEASTSGSGSAATSLATIDALCSNKTCKRVREDLSKKWCERCRARQQRKISRQRMKAKIKKEAEQQASGSGSPPAAASPPQSASTLVASSSSKMDVSWVAGDPEISEVEAEVGDPDAQMLVEEEGSDGAS